MKPARNETAYAIGYVSMGLILGGLFSAFVNFIASLFIEWPVTLENWLLTWAIFWILPWVANRIILIAKRLKCA